ncbi:MAG: hypothetical protein IKI08_06940 [Selenomonadaceae bacterium]|nr:hypothetical protein [Selenomonadaceae bacterium]
MQKSLKKFAIIVCNLDDGFRSQGLDTPEVAIKFVQMSPMDFEQTIIRKKVSALSLSRRIIPKTF